MPPSPTRLDDLFAKTMSVKLYQSIKESTVPPTLMPLLPGTLSEYDHIVPMTLTIITDKVALLTHEPIAQNTSANELGLSPIQSLKDPLGCFLHFPTT